MMEDSQCQQLISWEENGSTFRINGLKEFEQEVITSYFNHIPFDDFVR